MTFPNPVTGSDNQLIIDDIKSQNYVQAVSGWIIRKDGSAEFLNLTAIGATFQDIKITGEPLIQLQQPSGYVSLRRIVQQQNNFFKPQNTFGGFQPATPAAAVVINSVTPVSIFTPQNVRPLDVDYNGGLSGPRILVDTGTSRVIIRIECTLDVTATTPGTTVFLAYPMISQNGVGAGFTLAANNNGNGRLIYKASTGLRATLTKVWYLECKAFNDGGSLSYDVEIMARMNTGTDTYTINAGDSTLLVSVEGVYT